MIKSSEGGVGMLGSTENAQQLGYELGQNFAHALAARRSNSPVMPAAHQRRNCGRLGKAELGKGPQRVAIVVGAGEDEVARAREGRGVLEQLGIMPLDRGEMPAQVGDEVFPLRMAEECGDMPDADAIRRERMGLRVLDHLQSVLEAPQISVILDQHCRSRGVDAANGRETAQRLASGRDLQLVDPAAPDQLLRLSEEFDLPDSTPADLDVVPLNRDSPAAAMSVDLPLDR